MKIQKKIRNFTSIKNINFRASIVTLTQKNSGAKIAHEIVDTFNSKILPEIKKTQLSDANDIISKAGAGDVISKATDFQEKVNFFVLGGGFGSRFRELAQAVGDYNKISLPFKINENQDIHMLDFAMAMGKYFIGKEGVQKTIATNMLGSFGDIVMYYIKGNPIKNTVVCCGDNIFADKAVTIMEFFTKVINNPKKHIALVGVERTPKEVANRFGVLDVIGSLSDKSLKLKGFSEKPSLENAQKLVVNGQNIANTGLFYLSKDSMIKLVNELKNGINNIKKNDKEPYDFAVAVKYVHKKLPDWFKIPSEEGADVKVVHRWEDVGEPQALFRLVKAIKKGEFLDNFPKELAGKIQNSFNERIHLENKTPYILFTPSTKVSQETIAAAKEIEGVKIVA